MMHYHLTLTLNLIKEFDSLDDAKNFFDKELLHYVIHDNFTGLEDLPDMSGCVTEIK